MVSEAVTLNNGVKMPKVGLGTYLIPDGSQVSDAVTWALDSGYRHIDTAAYYGNEAGIGRAIRDSGISRQDIFVTTKLWNDDHGDVRGAFDASLERFGLDFIDQYLIHWPVSGIRCASWEALEAIYDEGLVRSIGVSNYTIRHLEELLANCSIKPAVNQVEFHPFLYQRGLMEYCHERGIRIVAYTPLVRARKMDEPVIADMAQKHGRTPAQILIRWGLQHGAISVPKSKDRQRIAENYNVFGFELKAEDMEALDSLDEGMRITWDPEGIP